MKQYITLFMLSAAMATAAEKSIVETQATPNELAERFVSNMLELRANGNPVPFKEDTAAFQWHCSCNTLADEIRNDKKLLNKAALTQPILEKMVDAVQLPSLVEPGEAIERYRNECSMPLRRALYDFSSWLPSTGPALKYPLLERNSKYKSPKEERYVMHALDNYAKKRNKCLNQDYLIHQ